MTFLLSLHLKLYQRYIRFINFLIFMSATKSDKFILVSSQAPRTEYQEVITFCFRCCLQSPFSFSLLFGNFSFARSRNKSTVNREGGLVLKIMVTAERPSPLLQRLNSFVNSNPFFQ